jgi:endonuclease VIII
MPEGDTLARIAVALRPYLAGRVVTGARARLPGPQISRIVGQKIDAVDAAGKNLLIKFDGGLELRTHLGLHGSWHRYRPGESWRRPPSRAALVIEVPGAVAVCFDAPVVELFERRAEVVHPTISMLGPDLLDDDFDQPEAVRRLRDKSRAETEIGEAILDQRAVAGVGNVYKSEVLFIERVNPFEKVGALDTETLERILTTARALLQANARSDAPAGRSTTVDPKTGKKLAPSRLWVYDRAGRPCHRCGTLIRSDSQGAELPRVTYWCASVECQAPAAEKKAAAKNGPGTKSSAKRTAAKRTAAKTKTSGTP